MRFCCRPHYHRRRRPIRKLRTIFRAQWPMRAAHTLQLRTRATAQALRARAHTVQALTPLLPNLLRRRSVLASTRDPPWDTHLRLPRYVAERAQRPSRHNRRTHRIRLGSRHRRQRQRQCARFDGVRRDRRGNRWGLWLRCTAPNGAQPILARSVGRRQVKRRGFPPIREPSAHESASHNKARGRSGTVGNGSAPAPSKTVIYCVYSAR